MKITRIVGSVNGEEVELDLDEPIYVEWDNDRVMELAPTTSETIQASVYTDTLTASKQVGMVVAQGPGPELFLS